MDIRWIERVVLLTLCVLLSACDVAGSGGGSKEDLLKPTAQSGVTARAGGLDSAALASQDMAGFTVSTTADRRKVQVTWNACAPLAYALSGTTVGKPTSTVVRQASGQGATVTVILAEYPSEQAQTAMDAVAAALDECTTGFTATVDGEKHKVGKVAPELAPEGVDQAMGLGATVERASNKTSVKVIVFRSANTMAYLSGTPTIPASILDAQVLKLTS